MTDAPRMPSRDESVVQPILLAASPLVALQPGITFSNGKTLISHGCKGDAKKHCWSYCGADWTGGEWCWNYRNGEQVECNDVSDCEFYDDCGACTL